jgi:YidC/Oxa1 family membrane protein insertase
LVLLGWTFLFPQQRPAAPPPQPAAKTAPVTPEAPSSPPAPSDAPVPATGQAANAPAAPSDAARPEQLVELVGNDVRFVFSTAGGTLRHAQLLDKKFLERDGDPRSGRDMVRTFDAADAPLRTTFPKASFAVPADGGWQVSRPAPDTVVFTAETADARIEKRYRADTTRYRLHLDVVVTNKSDKPQDHHLRLSVFGRQDPDKKGGGFLFFSSPATNQAAMLCGATDKIERRQMEKLKKEAFNKTGDVRWVAADEKYFLLAAVTYPEAAGRDRTCDLQSSDGVIGQGDLSFAGRTVAPHGSTVYSFAVFSGPKVTSDLEQVRPGGDDVKLNESVDVTFAFLADKILVLLKFFYRFGHNWGLAIILLTLFIKLITFYPTQKSLLSAKKMQKLAPKMAAIRKKYENDKQRQSVETMNLYKAHGVSPFGGCLPSLIQMPIWIALYSTLNYAVELYRAPFLGYIRDLTAKDPYYITPLLMGGVMFMQMKMSPTSPDNQQQATMAVMMPVMFTALSLFLPSGLALYMLTSYLIGIVQQLYVNHLDRKSATA